MASWIWVLIPLAAIFAGVVHKWLAIKERQIQAVSHEAAEKAAQYAAQTERLEQRVRVLERIVIDKGIDIAAEIEQLRDRPPMN
jgi:hypothetical protein